MESIFLTAKLIMFVAMEATVLVVIAAVLIAGVYQIVQDKVREARRRDQITEDEQWLKRSL